MRRYLAIIALFFIIFTTYFSVFLYAEESQEQLKSSLEQKIKDYQKKLDDLRSQKNTLSSQIQYMDAQVYLAELKIQETEKKIDDTTKEIDTLGSRIQGLDSSLDNLSKSLLERMVDGYKRRSATVIDMVLDSNNANELMSQYKYYKTIQDNNQKLLVQVQQTKLNFEEQKKLRENKVAELDKLKDTLTDQKADLISQQAAKRKLLAVTQNDEVVYKRLIEESRRQIESFRQFVQSTGVGVIGANSLGSGEGGWYYSQRDSRWASTRMGSSSESILDVGCFITSIAMVMKFYGVEFTPLDIATQPRYFSGGPSSTCFPTSYATAYLCVPSAFNGSWPKGLRYKNISSGDITSYLNKNVPVIAGVKGASHYIVLKKETDGQYIMNDPIYGPDKKVSDYYSLSGPYGVFE